MCLLLLYKLSAFVLNVLLPSLLESHSHTWDILFTVDEFVFSIRAAGHCLVV